MSPENIALLKSRKLQFMLAELDKLRLPGIVLRTGAPARDGVVSKFGGKPDLPADFKWPAAAGIDLPDSPDAVFLGRKLDYLLQINLEDVAPFDEDHLLPDTGLLTFFYDIEEMPWGFDPKDRWGFRVVYTPSVLDLVPHELPSEDYAVSESFIVASTLDSYPAPFSVEFSNVPSLNKMKRDLKFEFEELLTESVEADGASHRLLGYPDLVQNDMHAECQLASNGINCGSGVSSEHAHLLAGAKDWILLLQFASDDSLNVMWGDAGNIYFWIRKQDLAARRFDKTWLVLQCG